MLHRKYQEETEIVNSGSDGQTKTATNVFKLLQETVMQSHIKIIRVFF